MSSNITKISNILICFSSFALLVLLPYSASAHDTRINPSPIEDEYIITHNPEEESIAKKVRESVQRNKSTIDSSEQNADVRKKEEQQNYGDLIVETARTQLGRPYKHASSSPEKGFDCSGLVNWVFKQHGINTPRSTPDLLRIGVKISPNQLKPGDIVITKHRRNRNSPHGLHAGIYVGNGVMIHAPGRNRHVMEVKMTYFNVKEGRRVI